MATPPTLPIIIESVCQKLARAAAKNHALTPLLTIVWTYLRHLIRRLERLHNARPATPRPNRTRKAAPARLRLSTRFAWLLKYDQMAANDGTQLAHLLNTEEGKQFIAAHPKAAGMLRPLLKMLGQFPYPEAVAPAPKPRRIRPPRPRREKPAPLIGGKYTIAQSRRYSPGRIPDIAKKAVG